MRTRTTLLLIAVVVIAIFRFVLPSYFPGHEAASRYAIIGILAVLILLGTALQFRRKR